MKWPRFQPVELLAASILLSIASFFRFHDLAERLVFQGDQARALLAARDILAGEFTLIGPETSVSGFHLGPFFYYLIAPALWLSEYDPLGPAALTALFGVATVLLLFLYGKRFFSFETGFIMALLYAASPLAIWQSRIALEPAPVPFYSVLWLYSVTAWLQEKKKIWLLSTGICIFLGVQLNFSFVSLLPASLWLLLLAAPTSKHRIFLLQGVSLLGMGFLAIVRVLWKNSTDWGYFQHIFGELTLPNFPEVALALAALCLIFAGFWHWKNHSDHFSELLLPSFAWFVFCFTGFVLKTVSGQHSLALIFPAPALFTGILLFLWSRRNVFRKQISFISVCVVSLLLFFQTFQYLHSHDDSFLSEYRATTTHILELSEEKAYRFVYRGHLDVYNAADDAYQYLLWKEGNAPVQSYRREITPQTQDHWNTRSIPPERTIVLYQPPFNFSEYRDYQEAIEWRGQWFVVQNEESRE